MCSVEPCAVFIPWNSISLTLVIDSAIFHLAHKSSSSSAPNTWNWQHTAEQNTIHRLTMYCTNVFPQPLQMFSRSFALAMEYPTKNYRLPLCYVSILVCVCVCVVCFSAYISSLNFISSQCPLEHLSNCNHHVYFGWLIEHTTSANWAINSPAQKCKLIGLLILELADSCQLTFDSFNTLETDWCLNQQISIEYIWTYTK